MDAGLFRVMAVLLLLPDNAVHHALLASSSPPPTPSKTEAEDDGEYDAFTAWSKRVMSLHNDDDFAFTMWSNLIQSRLLIFPAYDESSHLLDLLKKHDIAIPVHTFYRNDPRYWHMLPTQAIPALLKATHVLVFAESCTEVAGDTTNTYCCKRSGAEVRHIDLRRMLPNVYMLSYQVFVEKVAHLNPPVHTAPQTVQTTLITNPSRTVPAPARILSSPNKDAAVLTTTCRVTLGACACRSAKKGLTEVYVSVVNPVGGWALKSEVVWPSEDPIEYRFSDEKKQTQTSGIVRRKQKVQC